MIRIQTYLFKYLDYKSFEAFQLIDKYYLKNVFEYLDVNTLKDYLSRLDDWKWTIPQKVLTLNDFKSVNLKDRFWKFLYLDKKNIEAFKLQIAASELSVIAALIVTYVVITSGNYSIITSIENPTL